MLNAELYIVGNGLCAVPLFYSRRNAEDGVPYGCLTSFLCKNLLTSVLGNGIMKMQRILGKGGFIMTKEEILEMSRKENTVADEREQYILNKANNLGGFISIIVALFLMMINTIADGPEAVNVAIWSIYWVRFAITYGYQAFLLKKKSYWFFTVFFSITAVFTILGFLKTTLGW